MGKQSRDFIYIDDAAGATIAAIEKANANIRIFNVGTGVRITVLEIVKTLMDNFDILGPTIISGNYRKGDLRHNFAARLAEVLDFTAKVNISEGIEEFVNWVNQQPLNECD